jgi:hypothetical protein
MHGQPIIKMTRYGLGLELVLLEKLILVQPVKYCNYS